MAEAEKQQKLVKLYTMIASGMAAMVAALFTSKLGVAGTLIGTALTAMTINLGSAVLSAQLAKKPPPRAPPCRSTCGDRLSTQKVRIPGKESPEPDPEPSTRSTNGGGQRGRLLSRLQSIPDDLKNLPSARRRSILLAGVLAGLVATISRPQWRYWHRACQRQEPLPPVLERVFHDGGDSGWFVWWPRPLHLRRLARFQRAAHD